MRIINDLKQCGQNRYFLRKKNVVISADAPNSMSAKRIHVNLRLVLHAAAQDHNILRTNRAEGISAFRNHFFVFQHFFNSSGDEFTFNLIVGDFRLGGDRLRIQAMQLHRTVGGFRNDRFCTKCFIIPVAQTSDALGHT